MLTLRRTRLVILVLTGLVSVLWVQPAFAAPLDGVVYDARTGEALEGARLALYYDASDVSEPGMLVPAERLSPGEQNQVTGRDGAYFFDLPGGRVYQLRPTSRADHYSFPSVIVPPEPGFPRFGDISDSRQPGDSGERPFYTRFDATSSNARFRNNHIALDRMRDVVSLELKSDRTQAGVGDVLSFAATLENNGERALGAEEGEAVYLLLVAPRGLTVNVQSAVVETQVSGRVTSTARAAAARVDANSERLIRFGPFDVPPATTLRLRYQATVGIDRKAGQVSSRIVAQDAGGIELSGTATARVVLSTDRDFSTSTIIGRAFCDDDDDGVQDLDESGVFGARIYADTGAIAISDRAGRFHFTRIAPGSHVFKIDVGSLAGATLKGDDKRLLQLSEGLPMQLDFPVQCVASWISSEHARIVLPLAPEKSGDGHEDEPPARTSVLVRGRLSPMSIEVDGQRQDLPSIELKLDAPATLLAKASSAQAGPSLQAVPAAGYAADVPRWSLIWTDAKIGQPVRWRFTIERVEAGGLAPVFHRDGVGAPPAVIDWNGLNDAGTAVTPAVHVTRLTLVTDDGTEVASRREPFGVGVGGAVSKEIVATGELFRDRSRGPEVSAALREKVQVIASQLGDSGRVDIEVHGDGSGDRLKSLVTTQTEARQLQELLVGLGVDASRITARGRGAAEPVSAASGPAARRENRRVVFSLHLGDPSMNVVPLDVVGKSELRISGRLIPLDALGGFETRVPFPEKGWITIDMLAASGRRAAFRTQITSRSVVHGSDSPRKPSTGARKRWRVVGDVAAEHLEIDFARAPAALWNADVALAAVDSLPIPEIVTEGSGETRALSSPLDFQVTLGETLAIRRWTFFVADASGRVTYKKAQAGRPPPVVRWDGTDQGIFVLLADARYTYWLDVETSDASALSTAPHWFHVDPLRSGRVLEKQGRLFARNGTPRAALRNQLSRFAAQVARSPGEDRFALVLEVAGDQFRVDGVRAALVSYLNGLDIDPGRYDLAARERVGRDDRIAIVRDSRPPQTTASVSINNQLVALQGTSFSSAIELAEGEPLVVEFVSSEGGKLRYIGNASQPARTDSAGGELIAPGHIDASASFAEEDDEVLASDTPARSLRVQLPPQHTVLADRHLAIVGEVAPGTRIKINAREVAVRPDGRFNVVTELPLGNSDVIIRADDVLGGSSTIRWPLRVSRSHSVVVGHIEGVVASAYAAGGFSAESAAIAGMVPDSTLQIGPVLFSARAQGFVKARVPGGMFADTVEITAQIDTGRDTAGSEFFRQVIDPRRSAPTLGDEAVEVQDANTRSKVYAQVKAGQSTATIGSVHTRLEGGGELFEYDRVADGAVAEVHKAVAASDVAVRAFTTTGAMSSSRDVNWFRATGGTLFYLRHGHLIEGSELVRVVVRDRDSGMALDEHSLQEGVDYSVDYQSGRIRLATPLSGTSASTWVLDNMASSTTPMSGHLVYLSVTYEHEDQDGLGQRARGAYASTTLEERLSVGAGIVSEHRDGQEGYRLLGADASLNIGSRSNLRAEIAGSRQRDASHSLSMDGGLSFGALQQDSAFATAGSGLQIGWKLSADFAAADWTGASEFRDTGLSLYLQDLERGFASGDSVLDQGRLKFGARLQQRLSDIDMLLVRHEAQVSQLARVGPTLRDVMANPSPLDLDETATYLTSIQWARDAGRWHYKLEGMHQRLTSTAALADDSAVLDARRLGAGALTAYDYNERLTLRVGQQVVASAADGDPVLNPIAASGSSLRSAEPLAGVVSNVGGDLALAPELSISGDLFQRWNGDNAARVGLKTALSDRGSMYVQEQVGGVDGRLSNTTIIGAEDRFGEDSGGRSYGEYQVHRGVLGNRNRAVMGLGRRLQLSRHTGLGLGLEHQQAFGGYLPDGTSIGDAQRNVMHGAMTYHRKGFRLAAQLELRFDHGDEGNRVDPAVLGDDPREGIAPGSFADHGGVVPGAALVIAPGTGTQVIGGLAGEWRFHQEFSWLGRARSSMSRYQAPRAADDVTLARFTELTTGWAYRSERDDRFQLISRYSYLLEQRPSSLLDPEHTERSHVVAIMPFARLPHHILLSGKLALKSTKATDTFTDLEPSATSVNAVLALVRLGYQFYGNWDASAEVRQLALVGKVDSEWSLGNLLEVGYTLSRQLRLAGGYNFGHFSDDELGDLTRDSHGVFMRITGMY